MENMHLADWPDVIVPVQTLSDSGIPFVPKQYIRPISERPNGSISIESGTTVKIPIIDLAGFESDDEHRKRILQSIADACRSWGFFQVLNHGVDLDAVKRVRQVWREFFLDLPVEQKKLYANSPMSYEGYGSRVGVEKGAILDWNDYYFLHVLPTDMKNFEKWPKIPCNLRDVTEKYTCHMMNLSNVLLKAISSTLELEEDHLHTAFGGGEGISASVRVTYYPKCPQPDLTLGLSPHTDVGGITLLLIDDHVAGTQVLKENTWVTMQPVPGAFIVNVGDQIQIISNGRYKSVVHRVLANSDKERVNIAFFCNPRGDLPIAPASELVSSVTPALYHPMTFNEYRKYAHTKGINVREQIESSSDIKK